jgi:hypothetical protein
MLQLNPPIPVWTKKGTGLAWVVIDYGAEHHLMWVIAMDATGEVWTLSNPHVRAQKNISMDRTLEEIEMPLVKGKAAKTKKGFSENVKREMNAGKPQKQAVAIAYSEAGESKKKKAKKK